MIRNFEDDHGRPWEVVRGRSSWGGWHALFVSRDGGEVREVGLDERSAEGAASFLSEADAAQLAELFARSRPRQDR